MVANVLTSPLPVRQKQMTQGSVSNKSYEAPQSYVPREYNFAMDSVVGAAAFAEIANVKDGRVPKLRTHMRGAEPGVGESRFVFPSDCF